MKTVLPCLILLLGSCAVIKPNPSVYSESIYANDRALALQQLQHSKEMQANRNALLYYLEAGKLQADLGNYEVSNRLLNIADLLMGSDRYNAADIAKGLALNNRMMFYQTQSYEPFFVHYYKALNYARLRLTEDATVEARRIILSANRLENNNRFNAAYKKDAFAANLQGILFEQAGDINNAFIAYRNAANLYRKNHNSYYGVEFPYALQEAEKNAGAKLGISDLHIFPASLQQSKSAESELILFVEQGFAPHLVPNFIELNRAQHGWQYYDGCDTNMISLDEDSAQVQTNYLRIAMPVYSFPSPHQFPVTVIAAEGSYIAELACNVNELALQLQQQQLPKKLALAAGRQLLKQTLAASAEAIGKKDDDGNNEKDTKGEIAGKLAGSVIKVFSYVTEQPDLRSWRSLPAFIYYVRIPLKNGEDNLLTIQQHHETKTITIKGRPGLQLMNVRF